MYWKASCRDHPYSTIDIGNYIYVCFDTFLNFTQYTLWVCLKSLYLDIYALTHGDLPIRRCTRAWNNCASALVHTSVIVTCTCVVIRMFIQTSGIDTYILLFIYNSIRSSVIDTLHMILCENLFYNFTLYPHHIL